MKQLKNLDLHRVQKLAQDLAKKYRNKDVVIGLSGPLGAGKTAFVKAFASSLGIKRIKSPTFIVGNRYNLKNQHLYHYDFYRLHNQKQLIPLDFAEILTSPNRILLIEWVEKFPTIAKKCDLNLTFEITGKNLRNVTIR